ncbi:MAG: PD-(D/E)XK nuclease family protein [Firmicutes bacterium]|nr:PD-(D/E)XK nuclease family protein [Bacillota bacterium]
MPNSVNMARVEIYKAGSWHDFIANYDLWRGTGASFVILPENEDKFYTAKLFKDLNISGIFTITELIGRYLKNAGKKGLISKQVLESLLGSIISRSTMPYFKIEEYKQGYVKALTDFIYNFQRTSTTDLQSAIGIFKNGRLTLKEKDLIKIYAEYEAKLPEYGFDLKSGLAEFIRQTDAENIRRLLGIPENGRVIFAGFDYISPLEEQFILTVFQKGGGTAFLACENPAAPEQAVRIRKNVVNLLERSQNITVEHKIPPLCPEHFFGRLSNRIFNSDPALIQEGAAVFPQPGKVVITKDNNRFTEIVSIARRIKHLAEAGVPFREIRIVAPEYQLYGQIIEEVFPDYGIPFSMETGVPLLRFPLASVILQTVSQSINANPYTMREKLFSSPYLSFTSKIGSADLNRYQDFIGVRFVPEDKLEQLVKSNIIYRLDFNYIQNTREKAYRAIKPLSGAGQFEVIKRYLDGLPWDSADKRLEHLGHCLIQLYLLAQAEKALSVWRTKMDGSEFKESLLGLLHRFRIEENISFLAGLDGSPVEYKVQERDQAILKLVQTILDQLIIDAASLEKPDGEKLPLVELARIFTRLMNEARLPASDDGGISVQPAGWGQYKLWEYTFICGLVDEEFPGRDDFNFLHPKKDGLSLGNDYTTVDHARNYFYHLVRSTGRALFLSAPLSHNGRKLSPSPFIKEIEKILPAEAAGQEEPSFDSGRRYSLREKLIFIGKNADLHYDLVLPLLKEVKLENETYFNTILEILRFDGLTLSSLAFSEFDGIFHHNSQATADLLRERLKQTVFTPEVLERYAACPLRFLFGDILGLKTEPDYHPDVSANGVLIRSILKEYTARACEIRGIPEDAAGFLKNAIARQVKESYQDGEDAFQVRFIKGLSAGLGERDVKRPGLFYAFLKHEKEAPDLLQPYSGNIAGLVRLSDELAVQVEIDRADLTRAGDYIVLFSYTTADTGNPAKVFRGLRFDLPLAVLLFSNYAAGKRLRPTVAGAGMYLVKSPRNIKRGGYFAVSDIKASRQTAVCAEQPVFSGQREGFIASEDFETALEKIKDHIKRLYALMKKGVFHLPLCDEADQTCANCTFRRICRKDQPRLDRIWAGARDDEGLNIIREII